MKILVIKKDLPAFESEAALSCVSYQKEGQDVSEIAAAFVHKNNDKDRKWLKTKKIRPCFVVGEDTLNYEEVRETINLPRALFEERVTTFLMHFQSTNNVDKTLFSVSAKAFSDILAAAIVSHGLRFRTLRVAGFKSCKDSALLQLQDLSVLVGRNASGKSALLEALALLQEALEQGLGAAISARYHVFSDLLTKGCDSLEIELGFECKKGIFTYLLQVGTDGKVPLVVREQATFCDANGGKKVLEIDTPDGGDSYHRTILQGNPVFDRDRLALSQVGPATPWAFQVQHFLQKAIFLRLSPRSLAQPGPLRRGANKPLLDEDGAALPALLESLGPGEKTKLVRLLQETLGSWVQEVGLERAPGPQQGYLVMGQDMAAQRHQLPTWVLSEGTRRLVAIYALAVCNKTPSFLAIEEIENGLDPWTLSLVLRELRERAGIGTTVLMTTHSPYFLDKFLPKDIIHVILQEGISRYRQASTYADVMKYEGEITAGVLYKEGYFREKP